jgi:hypothetical protein
MGSGKTTLAEYLTSDHGFMRLSLAGTLKRMVRTFLKASGLTDDQADTLITDPVLKETPLSLLNGKSPRFAMQTLGTDWGRELFGDDLWVNSTMGRVRRHMSEGKSVVIDDLRFPNEADAIKAAGGYVVRVVRPGATITNAHASEGGLDSYKVDAQVVNDSSRELLRYDAWNLLRHIVRPPTY